MKMPKLNFKVLFDNDKFLWFLSFLFAFMLWFTVVNTIDTTADRSITNVPVSFDSSSESLEAMGLDVVLDEPIMVKVDMSGERSVVANVDRQDLLVQADLTGVTSAGNTPSISRSPTVWDGTSITCPPPPRRSQSGSTVR